MSHQHYLYFEALNRKMWLIMKCEKLNWQFIFSSFPGHFCTVLCSVFTTELSAITWDDNMTTEIVLAESLSPFLPHTHSNAQTPSWVPHKHAMGPCKGAGRGARLFIGCEKWDCSRHYRAQRACDDVLQPVTSVIACHWTLRPAGLEYDNISQ